MKGLFLIQKMQHYYSRINHDFVVPIKVKNIVLVGRKGVGKSTLIRMLLDPTGASYQYIGALDDEFGTIRPLFIEGERLALNFIEIPIEPQEFSVRNSEALATYATQMISKCVDRGFTRIHLVCFVTSLLRNDYMNDLETAKRMMIYLDSQISPIVCLIITNAESQALEKQEKIRQHLNKVYRLENLCRGIFFTGSMSYDGYLTDSSDIDTPFRNIMTNRDKLLRTFKEKSKPIQIISPPLAMDDYILTQSTGVDEINDEESDSLGENEPRNSNEERRRDKRKSTIHIRVGNKSCQML